MNQRLITISDDISYLLTLPREIRCLIFSYPMTIQDFFSIRETSKTLKDDVEKCVEVLTDDGKDGSLEAELIISLPKISVLPVSYSINVADDAQLVELAKHPTLTEATFDLTSMITDYDVDYYQAILQFFRLYRLRGSDCHRCSDIADSRYRFTFYWHNVEYKNIGDDEYGEKIQEYVGEEEHITEVSEGGIYLINPYIMFNAASFFPDLSKNVPICEYRGPLTYTIVDISKLPCLEKVYFKFDYTYYISLTLLNGLTKSLLQNPNITEYYISYESDESNYYSIFIGNIVAQLTDGFSNTQQHQHIRTFFPIDWINIDWVVEIFPNLQSISINFPSLQFILDEIKGKSPGVEGTLQQFNDNTSYLQNIPEINIVGNTNNNQEIIDLFPPEFHDRITFVKSNWLS